MKRVLPILLACAVVSLSSVHAAAPAVKMQAPGFYRMLLGDFEITALNDGTMNFTVSKVLQGASSEELNRALSAMDLTDSVETSFNAFLVNTGDKLVLIDTGVGSRAGIGSLGHLSSNLLAAGYRPSQVDEIYITHMHGDHIGGLVVGARRAFPNAQLRASSREADYWLHLDESSADDVLKVKIHFVRSALKPYIDAGRFSPFDGDVTLVKGIRSLQANGHTPGHTAYLIESREQRLLVWGDLVHVSAVQLTKPEVTFISDVEASAAAEQRRRLLQMASELGYWVAGAHLPFPGLGHIHKDDERYRWVPANYTR